MVAIKELTKEDENQFKKFIETKREKIPSLQLAELPYPNEEIIILKNFNIEYNEKISKEYNFNFINYKKTISAFFKNSTNDYNKNGYIFSGYILKEGKLFFGNDDVVAEKLDLSTINQEYGEYVLCRIEKGEIELSSDFFGMSQWYYYVNERKFAASNSYHLLLIILKKLNENLSVNIKKSRVNLITTGFTFGSCFTKEMDINNCFVNLPYEIIKYNDSLKIVKTELYDIITTNEEYNEDVYECYIRKAAEEIAQNTKAYFKHSRFKNIIVDISGGFDSRIVFAAANNLPKKYRKKIKTHTRNSGTSDDNEKAKIVKDVYKYEEFNYNNDKKLEFPETINDNSLNIPHISRTLGSYSNNTHLYISSYTDYEKMQLTGYLGEVVFGYKRVRGELDYTLGDQRLLARLGGCYLWNSVKQLEDVFEDQKKIINKSIEGYNCNDLFKKMHILYLNYRNRFICNSSHNIEYNNFRATSLHSKYALKAKWLYFNTFDKNKIPTEKVSIDILTILNPLLAILPFSDENNDVVPPKNILLNPVYFNTKNYKVNTINVKESPYVSYRESVIKILEDFNLVKQMLLSIYDYSAEYYNVCMGLYKVLEELILEKRSIKNTKCKDLVRKIFDLSFQIDIVTKKNLF